MKFVLIDIVICCYIAAANAKSVHILLMSGAHKQICHSSQECSKNMECLAEKCECKVGFAYDKLAAECSPFMQFACSQDIQCEDIDHNRVCSDGRCRCREGLHELTNMWCSDEETTLASSITTPTKIPSFASTIWFSLAIPGVALIIFILVVAIKYKLESASKRRRIASNELLTRERVARQSLSVISAILADVRTQTANYSPPYMPTRNANRITELRNHNHHLTDTPPPKYHNIIHDLPPSYESLRFHLMNKK